MWAGMHMIVNHTYIHGQVQRGLIECLKCRCIRAITVWYFRNVIPSCMLSTGVGVFPYLVHIPSQDIGTDPFHEVYLFIPSGCVVQTLQIRIPKIFNAIVQLTGIKGLNLLLKALYYLWTRHSAVSVFLHTVISFI